MGKSIENGVRNQAALIIRAQHFVLLGSGHNVHLHCSVLQMDVRWQQSLVYVYPRYHYSPLPGGSADRWGSRTLFIAGVSNVWASLSCAPAYPVLVLGNSEPACVSLMLCCYTRQTCSRKESNRKGDLLLVATTLFFYLS